jgi:hypothetical protein
MVNANHAATQVRADWLLHCDADEFLSAPLDGVLASIAPEVQVIGLSAVERCWLAGAPPAHVFDGVFRGPLPKLGEGPEQVYGPDAAFMTRGVLAYVGCKSLTRVGSGLFVSIHDAFRRGPGGGPLRTAPVVRARPWAPPGILHFDGLTRLHWVLKLTRYAQVPQKGRAAMLGPARSRQVEFVRAHRDAPGAAAALHDRLRLLSPAAAERRRGLGGLNEAGFDPRAAVAAMFPDHRFDFSEAGFDRRIRRRHPKLTAAM